MDVLLLSRYESMGASSRLRSYQYLPYLESRGIRVQTSPFFANAYLEDFYSGRGKGLKHVLRAYWRRIGDLLLCNRFHLLWIEAELLPWLPAWAEALLSRISLPYVVDYDDAIFHRYDLHRNSAVRLMLGRKIDTVMRHARIVVAGSTYLAERAHAAGARRVETIPTSIDLDRFPDWTVPAQETFTVGWIGSSSTAGYMVPLAGVFEKLAQERPLQVRLVGAGNLRMPGPSQIYNYRLWSENDEVADMQSFDVGIMPLPDTPWDRGKCGFKLIQYMGCFKPVVASPVGANLSIVTAGVNGFLADSDEDWLSNLRLLRDNPSLANSMGQAGRLQVAQNYCTSINGPRLAQVLFDAAQAS